MSVDVLVRKLSKGMYLVFIQERDPNPDDCPTYGSIAQAIKESALDLPETFPQYMNVSYDGMWSGTYPVAELAEKSDEVADRLVALVAHCRHGM